MTFLEDMEEPEDFDSSASQLEGAAAAMKPPPTPPFAPFSAGSEAIEAVESMFEARGLSLPVFEQPDLPETPLVGSREDPILVESFADDGEPSTDENPPPSQRRHISPHTRLLRPLAGGGGKTRLGGQADGDNVGIRNQSNDTSRSGPSSASSYSSPSSLASLSSLSSTSNLSIYSHDVSNTSNGSNTSNVSNVSNTRNVTRWIGDRINVRNGVVVASSNSGNSHKPDSTTRIFSSGKSTKKRAGEGQDTADDSESYDDDTDEETPDMWPAPEVALKAFEAACKPHGVAPRLAYDGIDSNGNYCWRSINGKSINTRYTSPATLQRSKYHKKIREQSQLKK